MREYLVKDDAKAVARYRRSRATIVTYNKRDVKNIGKFGLRVLDPRELVFEIGDIK